MVRAGSVWRAAGRHPDVVAAVVVSLAAGLLRLAFLYRAPVFLTGDSQSHFLPGYDLAHGLTFDPELRRPPGYPLFVAGVIGLFGEDLRALAFAQHVLGTLTALFTYVLGRLAFGRVAGLIGGLLVSVNGALILSEHSVMTEGLFGTLLVAGLTALTLGLRGEAIRASAQASPATAGNGNGHVGARRVSPLSTGARHASSLHGMRSRLVAHTVWLILGGSLLGLAALTRPVAQILVPTVLFWLLLVTRDWRRTLRGALLVGIGFTIVVGPWMFRNQVEHGSLTASGGLGRSLVARTIKYDYGYFEDDRPVVGPDDMRGQVRQFIRGKRNAIRNSRSVRSTQSGLMKELGLTQAQSDGLMRQVVVEAISERPGYYLLGSLQMAAQIVVGKSKEDALATRWVQRTDKDWVEQWEGRVDHLVTPNSVIEQREQASAEAIVSLYQPAALGMAMPLLAVLGLGLALAAPTFRSALLVGLTAVALVLASAALDGPVPRYRYPVDPLIGLLAAGSITSAVRLLVSRRWPFRPRLRSGVGPRDPAVGAGASIQAVSR